MTTDMEILEAKKKLETQLDELVQLRPLPIVALRIMKACREEQVDVRSIVQLVECDPAITSRILSAVNSSVFGYARSVSSINQAVVVLGSKSLSRLAVSVATANVFSEGDSATEDRLRLFEHSLGCASVSRIIANEGKFSADAGEAFLAGMLHDVGKLILFDVAPLEYKRMEQDRIEGSPLQLERQAFGIDHALLGEKFGEFWELPDSIRRAISNHHGDVQSCGSVSTDEVTTITNIANDLAKSWGIGQETETPLGQAAEDWLSSHAPEDVQELRSTATEHFEELKSVLSC